MQLIDYIRDIVKFTNKRIDESDIDWSQIKDQDDATDLIILNNFIMLETDFVLTKLESVRNDISDNYSSYERAERVHQLSVIFQLDTGRRGCQILKRIISNNIKRLESMQHAVSFNDYPGDEEVEQWNYEW